MADETPKAPSKSWEEIAQDIEQQANDCAKAGKTPTRVMLGQVEQNQMRTLVRRIILQPPGTSMTSFQTTAGMLDIVRDSSPSLCRVE